MVAERVASPRRSASGRRGGAARARAALVAGLVFASVGVAAHTNPTIEAAGIVFVVDSTADDVDAAPGDGICDTGTGGATPVCTLRAALDEADARPGHDTIEFAIPGPGPHRLDPASMYPRIDDPAGVTIDGYSQPGASPNTLATGTDAVLMIEIRGRGPDAIDGFDIRSANNVITGVSMFDFVRHIRIFGSAAHDNRVVGNFLGTDASATFGQVARQTNANAVHIERGASANRIGMPGAANRNLFAGNADKGVAMFDSGTQFNLVQNNLFGLTPDGSARLTNWGHGIDINFNASYNVVGGWNPGEGNVVAGSELSGIEISHNVGTGVTTGNQVVNNLIGTVPDGSAAPIYAGNREFGINFEGKPRCADSCPVDISGNLAAGNVVVGSNADVMFWKGANDNLVVDNIIGVLADGSPAESSAATTWGVLIQAGAFDNRVERNTIAGVPRGVMIKPDNDFPSECLASDVVCPEDASFPTYGNTLSRNSIRDIGPGLGIDLSAGGFSSGPDDPPTADVQGGIAIPVVTEVTTDALTATTCAGCTVEVFVTPTPACTGCFEAYGRGERWVADGTADAAGDVTVTFRSDPVDAYVVLAGSQVAIHTTDAAGNTSEHSLRHTVTAGLIAPPASPTTTISPGSSTSMVSLPPTTMAPTTTTTTLVSASMFMIRGPASADVRAVRCTLDGTC
ncbi:CSLREA domain-containing protein [Ilumatobacter coccineus]|nr:CSLREA domain-containing protein [Ilumatobacter coccineus]